MNPFFFFISSMSERLKPLGQVIYDHLKESRSKKEIGGTRYTYSVIRDQLQYCQNGGENSPCSTYCNVPEGVHYHGSNTFAPKTTVQIADFLKENKIGVAAHVGAEGYHRFPTEFTWTDGLRQLKPETAEYIMGYYDEVIHEPIRLSDQMNGTDLAIIKDAILKDRQFIVQRPTNGIELMKMGEKGKKLIPLISKFVDHLTYSYHFKWNPYSADFAKQDERLQRYLDLAKFTSGYTTAKFLRVITQERDPVQTLALADRVLQQGSVFFDFTIHDGKGNFSTSNQEAVPTMEQLETLSLGLLSRLVFFDQMVKSNLDYLLMTPTFGSHYINCGGHDKAVFVVRATEDGTPVQDVCSEIPVGMAFPTRFDDPTWIQAQDEGAHSCKNCRQVCEGPFRWNRDLSESQRPLSAITTFKQIGKVLRVQGFGNEDPVRYTPYKRSQLSDPNYIRRLLHARAIMVADRYTMPYWQEIAQESGLTEHERESVVERYAQEEYDESFIAQYQRLEEQVGELTQGPYPDEKYWYNKAAHSVANLWGGGGLLERPLILTTREQKRDFALAPVRAAQKLSGTIKFPR